MLTDILTDNEIVVATILFVQLRHTGRFAAELDRQIITPNLVRINHQLGQENDARYLAYAVEHILNMLEIERTQS